ncbi:MAG: glycoside hydrolase family 28 protein [Phycisphaerae bacterium]|jgi:hypothetical protein
MNIQLRQEQRCGHVAVIGLALTVAAACAHATTTQPSSAASAEGDNAMTGTQPWKSIMTSVLQHGAVGDGKTMNTEAIQAAIDVTAEKGGGVVYVPPGTYLTGPITLKSRITLSLEAGATLLGSDKLETYKSAGKGCLIGGDDLDDIAIVGRGTIDGQGGAFPRKQGPLIIAISRCRNVLIEGITLRNAGSWVQCYGLCDGLVIRGITVESFCNSNNDGLDIDSCRNVRVSDSRIWVGDDAFCLKSTYGQLCENVVITNCIASSHCNAFKLGTESYGGFKNIAISNCVVVPMGVEMKWHGSTEGNCGICLTIVDGGTMENVVVSNIAIRGTRAPIFIRLGNIGRPHRGQPKKDVGQVRNISINNVTAVSAARAHCEITGLPGHMLEDISLSNINLTFTGGGPADPNFTSTMPVKEKPEGYPDILWTHPYLPAYGLFSRHVKGLTLNNVVVKTEKPEPRSAMILEDIDDLRIDGFSGGAWSGSDAILWIKDVRGALIRGCVAMPNTGIFARLDGACRDIALLGNDLRKASQMFEFVGGASPDMVVENGNLLPSKPQAPASAPASQESGS